MPTVKRPGRKLLYAEIPEELYKRFKERARNCRREILAELVLALEWWLTTEPKPEPPPPPPPPKRPRGRPRKEE